MKYKEVKDHRESGQLLRHHLVDESGGKHGEYRVYHEDGQIWWHYFFSTDRKCGEVKAFKSDGILQHNFLMDGNGNELATVIFIGEPSEHTEEQLIEIAKEHNLPLLSELPKTEAERTHWNLKYPHLPCLPIESK